MTGAVPYWGDQDLVLRGLGRLYPTGGLEIVVANESRLVFVSGGRRGQPYAPPPLGTRALVLAILGGLDVTLARRSVSAWHNLGR